MRRLLLLALLAAPSVALAATAQSYDEIATAPYLEPDGTTQPAGTCIERVMWDGVSPFAPPGVRLVLDAAQTTPCYAPAPTPMPAGAP